MIFRSAATCRRFPLRRTCPAVSGGNPCFVQPRAAKAAPANYQRDGAMRTDANGGGGPNYWPNSFGGPTPDPKVAEPEFEHSGIVGRRPYPKVDDDFVQAGELYRKVMDDGARERLVGNIVAHLGNAQQRIQLRQAALFHKVDTEYGTRVAEGLKLDAKKVERLAGLSQEDRVKETM